jgi:hypothetical protein
LIFSAYTTPLLSQTNHPGFFNFQNEMLAELGQAVEMKLDTRNQQLQSLLTNIFQKQEQFSMLSQKLRSIRQETKSLHQYVLKNE